MSLGDTRWLDGLGGEVTTGLVACLALADSSIHVVTWESSELQQQKLRCRSPGRGGLAVVTGSQQAW